MKRLLRSLITSTGDNAEESYRNYITFCESGMGFETPHENRIWELVNSFCQEHNHSPSAETIKNLIVGGSDVAASDFYQIMMTQPPLYKGDFQVYLEDKAQERRTRLVNDLLNQAKIVLTTGVEIKDPKTKQSKISKGPIEAIRLITEKAADIIAPTLGGRSSGEITQDADRAIHDYFTVKADPRAGIGQFTGLKQMDLAIKGAKKHELWVHAGYTGHGKSMLAMNWAYNQSVFMGYNVMYVSLEMPYKQLRNKFLAMHSLHSKFVDVRMGLGIQKDPAQHLGLMYDSIKEGTLRPHEEQFLIQHLIPDLFNGEEYGRMLVEIGDPDKDEMTVADIRNLAEIRHKQYPLDMIIVDHALLLAPRRRTKSTTEDLNQVMRDLKKMAMSFNRGAGIPVVALFQISREGFKSAEKNGGLYNLTHLSYANECCAEGTPVATDRGWIPIESLAIGDKVWSTTGWKNVLSVFNQGTRDTVRVHTKSGEFVVTPNHKVRVWDAANGLIWKFAGDLVEGDRLVIPKDYPHAERDVESRGNVSYYYLQGLVSASGMRPSGIAHHTTPEVRTMMRSAITAALGAEVRPGVNVSQEVDKVCDVFQGYLWEVPEFVFRSHRKHVAAFLRGVFDWNASVTERGQLMANLPVAMVKPVQQLLQGLGISSHILKRPAHAECQHYSLVIHFTEDMRKFREVLGLSTRRTQEELGSIQPIAQELVPMVNEIATSGTDEISKELLREILPTYPAAIQAKYDDIFRHDIVEVVSAIPGIIAPVWDIEVDGDHEYMTPFHSAHNCERSADVLTAGWLSEDMKSQKRIQLQCLKSRDTAPFDPFLARIDFTCGRMFSTNEIPMTREEKKAIGDKIDSELKDLL